MWISNFFELDKISSTLPIAEDRDLKFSVMLNNVDKTFTNPGDLTNGSTELKIYKIEIEVYDLYFDPDTLLTYNEGLYNEGLYN